MIEQINYFVRIMALGCGLMLIAIIVANEVRDRLKLPLIGMLIGVSSYLIRTTPLSAPHPLIEPWLDLLSLSTPFWIWLFARTLFEREPEWQIVRIVIPVLLAGWFISHFIQPIWLVGFFILHIASLALIVDLIRVGVFERDDDLVEQRRPIRLWFPVLVAAQAASILIFEMAELAFEIDSRAPWVQLLNALIIVTLMLFAGLALLRTDPVLLLETGQKGDTLAKPPELDLSPAESVLHDKLKSAMADGLYRDTGLSIAVLAEQLDTPEHRLRALINQRLGYRNFSAFLNRHRIAEAREKLSSREDVDLPVLTIAMDLGYNSLPTFNRAFRRETGTTPSEFRKTAIAQSATDEAVQN